MKPISIFYSTPFDVPAPYSYEVSFEFKDGINIDFQLIYTNRDDLTEDEILHEGFSENDNFSWKGVLDKVWQNEIEDLLTKTTYRNSLQDQEIIIKRDGEENAPKNYKEWNLLIQDLIQAVFETSGKEMPWQLNLIVIKNGVIKKQELKVLFSRRDVDFAFGSNFRMDWSRAKKLMELIYLGEFDEQKANTQLPDKEGVYLCFDQATWYKLGQAITNPHGNKGYLGKLENELFGLI
jgi:hypothetical protein